MVNWIAATISSVMDAVSGMFIDALGCDMEVMEGYFPFIGQAFQIFQVTSWALLFIIVIWQIFRSFAGPMAEAEQPWHLLARGVLFALLTGYARPVFDLILNIARGPYTLMRNETIDPGAFTFTSIEATLREATNALAASATIVGAILLIVLMISLAWNYFKLLLEVVERYIVVGILCYTSPLAYCMGASKTTSPVFKSWCRMVGSQLLLLILNVWFLRLVNSAVAQFVISAGSLPGGQGSVFLWFFCALALLKVAQRMDSYLASLGLNVAQTGGNMGMELLMAGRALTGFGHAVSRTVGHAFQGAAGMAGGAGAAAGATGAVKGGLAATLANMFKGNSYVRDAVVEGGNGHMGAGGSVGAVERIFGGMAANHGATLTSASIASVAARPPQASGTIAGDIADRSLGNYMPHLSGLSPSDTRITGGRISTHVQTAGGQSANLEMFSAAQYDRPQEPSLTCTAADGSTWYQMASGEGAQALFGQMPNFEGTGSAEEQAAFAQTFPDAAARLGETEHVSTADGAAFTVEGAPYGPGSQASTVDSADGAASTLPGADTPPLTVRSVDDGVLECTTAAGGSALWYNGSLFEEPEAPHDTTFAHNGVPWYTMTPPAGLPDFEPAPEALDYNNALFAQYLPGLGQPFTGIDTSRAHEGLLELRHADGTGTRLYDATLYRAPRGEVNVLESNDGHQFYALRGTPGVENRPVYRGGKPVYENGKLKTEQADVLRYRSTPERFAQPERRDLKKPVKPPRKK